MVSGGDEIDVVGTWRSEEKDSHLHLISWMILLVGWRQIGFEMGFLIVIVNGYEMVDQRGRGRGKNDVQRRQTIDREEER